MGNIFVQLQTLRAYDFVSCILKWLNVTFEKILRKDPHYFANLFWKFILIYFGQSFIISKLY